MRKNNKKIKIFFFLFLLYAINLFSNLTGDFKEYLIYYDANSIGENSFKSYSTLRLDYKKIFKENCIFNIAYEIGQLIEQKQSIGVFPFLSIYSYLPYRVRDLNIEPVDNKHYELYQNLDRLYFNISLSKTDITIGRQPIVLGIAKEISPFDIIVKSCGLP